MKINQQINKITTLQLNMGNTNDLHPAFCFRYLHNDFGLSQLSGQYTQNFITKLDKLSKMSWSEINSNSRYKNGSEIIDRQQIKQSIPKEITPDMNILVFHLPDLFRLIGVRDGKVFYVLFIDINGSCYKHD